MRVAANVGHLAHEILAHNGLAAAFAANAGLARALDLALGLGL